VAKVGRGGFPVSNPPVGGGALVVTEASASLFKSTWPEPPCRGGRGRVALLLYEVSEGEVVGGVFKKKKKIRKLPEKLALEVS